MVAPRVKLTHHQIFDVMPTSLPDFKATAVIRRPQLRAEAKSLGPAPTVMVEHQPHRRPSSPPPHDLRGLTARSSSLEYDKSLELGFRPDMRRIMVHHASRAPSSTPRPPWLSFPFVSEVRHHPRLYRGRAPQPKVQCYSVTSPSPDKLDTLCELLRGLAGKRLIVFVNHRAGRRQV